MDNSPDAEIIKWDVFISHASEDKDRFVRPLVARLEQEGLRVWYDDHTLRLGDSLGRELDRGLRDSRFGIVVLSEAFFSKEWPRKELESLLQREHNGEKVILPIWLGVNEEYVSGQSPLLATRIAARASDGLDKVATQIRDAVAASSTSNSGAKRGNSIQGRAPGRSPNTAGSQGPKLARLQTGPKRFQRVRLQILYERFKKSRGALREAALTSLIFLSGALVSALVMKARVVDSQVIDGWKDAISWAGYAASGPGIAALLAFGWYVPIEFFGGVSSRNEILGCGVPLLILAMAVLVGLLLYLFDLTITIGYSASLASAALVGGAGSLWVWGCWMKEQ